MIENNYNIDNFLNPSSTYDKLSDKLKIGQLVLNITKKEIVKVDLKILKEIIDFETYQNFDQKYYLLNLSDKWLIKVFDFDEKFLYSHNKTIFTSRKHGLKIHKTFQFFIGYTIRENINNGQYKGTHNYKPIVSTVNELMDHLYLIKREQFDFSPEEIDYMNELFQEELK